MKLGKYKRSGIYRPVGFVHAAKDGGPVLRGQSSWRTVSGVFLNTDRTGWLVLEFRRYW